MTYLVKRHDVVQCAQSLSLSSSTTSKSNAVTFDLDYDHNDNVEDIDDDDNDNDNDDNDNDNDKNEDDHATCATATRRSVEFEWHVLYSTAFQAPALYFNANELGAQSIRCCLYCVQLTCDLARMCHKQTVDH